MGRALAMRIVKASAAAADRIRPPGRGVVVLGYHRVGARCSHELDMATDQFSEQMATLAASRRTVSLEQGLDLLTGPEPEDPADDPVVVTFDDGTADFCDEALPVLVRHGIPATLYLATDFIERGIAFPYGGTSLSWAAVREALATGLVTVGSHTHRHVLLDRVPAEEAADELDRSIGLIGERLGVAAEHFAYPKMLKGSPAAEEAVRARFRSAALGGLRPNRYGATDFHRLARSPIQRSDGMRWFGHKLAGGMVLEDRLRAVANRSRYAKVSQ